MLKRIVQQAVHQTVNGHRIGELTIIEVEQGRSLFSCSFSVELAMWTHYVARELKPEMLDDIPPHTPATNGTSNNAATVTTAATTTTTTDDEEEDLEFEDQNVKVINTKVPEGQNLDNTDDDSSSNLVDSTSTIPVLAVSG
jgi:hypothetical protein